MSAVAAVSALLIPVSFGPLAGTHAVGAQPVSSTVISLSMSPQSIGEGGAAGTTVTVTATLQGSATLAANTVVTLGSSLGGTAAAGTDYTHTALPASITILAGSSSASDTFEISPIQDDIDEDAGETVEVTGTASDASITVNAATLTIGDDDTVSNQVNLSASPSTINEAGPATVITVTAKLLYAAHERVVTYHQDKTVTLYVSSFFSTATEGESGDFTVSPDPPGTITIPAGQITGTTTVTISPVQDTDKEHTEKISIAGYLTEGTAPLPGASSQPSRVYLTDDDWHPPEAVAFLGTRALGSSSVRLSWSAPSTPDDLPLTGYTLQRRIAFSGGTDLWARGVTTVKLAPGATSYVAGGLACDTPYTWRLFASNADGDSAASNEATRRTSACPTGGGDGGGGSGGGGGGGGGSGGGGVESECVETPRGTVVLVNGWSAADIGTAVALAARTVDAVVVYTSARRLESDAEDALCALGPRRVIAVGGTAALAPAVLTSARGVLSRVEVSRVAGADRAGTAAQVAREVLGTPGAGGGRTVVVANGWSPPDVGVAAALAARTPGAAVLLSAPGGLPAAARRVLAEFAVVRVVVVGGERAVSAEVFEAIAAAAGDAAIERLTGPDRAATAAAAARRSLGDPGRAAARTLVIANGWSPPDVGIATALAARISAAAVAYTAPDELPEPTRELIADYRPARVVIIGGTGAVSADIARAIRSASPGTRLTRIAGSGRIDTAAQAAQWTPIAN